MRVFTFTMLNRYNPRFAPLILLFLFACQSNEYQLHGSPYEPNALAPDFAINSTEDVPYRLSDQLGRPVLLYFGYTYCLDICPTTISDMR